MARELRSVNLGGVDLAAVLQAGTDSPAVTLVAVIIGVSVTTAIFGWMMWHAWNSVERAETDSRHRRRIFIRLGLIYVLSATLGVGGVLSGKEPKESLIGLPVVLLLAWFWLRASLRVKVPPHS